MQPIRFVTLFSLFFFVAFAFSALAPSIPEAVPLALSATAPLVTLYLVYTVLRHGEASGKTFDEGQWYGDRPNEFERQR